MKIYGKNNIKAI